MNEVDYSLEDRKVLVIDDPPVNLGLMFDTLEQHGFRVVVAPEGKKTLQSIEHFQPDLILLNPKLYTELCAANQELVQLNANKDKFFSLISHDLRSLFQSLRGFSYLLVQELNSDRGLTQAEIREMVQSIHHSSETGFDLLENLLAWSRLQRDRVSYPPDRVELHQIAETTFGFLAQVTVSKQIELRNNIPPGLLVYIDRKMIETVLRNLTMNAVKFTPAGGQVSLLARLDDEAGWALVEVADTGVGISAEDQAKLFDIGTQHSTPGTAGEKGTGLGLIICQDLVERHGGRIWVEKSEPGRGTRMVFTVPVGVMRDA